MSDFQYTLKRDLYPEEVMIHAEMKERNAKHYQETKKQREKHLVNLLCDLKEGPELIMDYIKHQMTQMNDLCEYFKKQAMAERQLAKQTQSQFTQFVKSNDSKKIPNNSLLTYTETLDRLEAIQVDLANDKMEYSLSLDTLSQDIKGILDGHENSRKQFKHAFEDLNKKRKEQEKQFESIKKEYEMYVSKWEEAIAKRIDYIEESAKSTTEKKKGFGIFNKSMNTLQSAESKYATKTGDRALTFHRESRDLMLFYQNHYRIFLPKVLHSCLELSEELSDRLKWAWLTFWRKSSRLSQSYLDRLAGSVESSSTPAAPEEQPSMKEVLVGLNLERDLEDFIKYCYNNNEKNYLDHVEDTAVLSRISDSKELGPQDHIQGYFGLDLTYVCDRDDVNAPPFLENVMECLARYIERVDIFQTTESLSSILSLRNQINKHAPSVEYKAIPMPLLCEVLLWYFREMPDGLIPTESMDGFIAAIKQQDPRKQVINVHDCINRLPDANYCTLAMLIKLLSKIVDRGTLSASTVALRVTPSLVRVEKHDMVHACHIVETIIEHQAMIFE